eukprot:PhM_4_TR18507/c3_g1_i1/m.56675
MDAFHAVSVVRGAQPFALPAPAGLSLFGAVREALANFRLPQELFEALSPVGPDSDDRTRFFALRLRAPAAAKDAFFRWVDGLDADTGHTTDLVRLQLLMGCIEWNPGPSPPGGP